MTNYNSHGFDLVVELSEKELNEQLKIKYELGELPQEVIEPFAAGGINLSLTLLFFAPEIDLASNVVNGIKINYPFGYSTISGTCINLTTGEQVSVTAEPLAGSIVIEDTIKVRPEGNSRTVHIDFTDGVDNVEITFTPETETIIQNNLGPCGIILAALKPVMQQVITEFLETDLQSIIIDERVVQPTSIDPFTITELDIRVISDDSRYDGDCIAYLLSTIPGNVGNPVAFSECAIPSGKNAVIMINNDLVLGKIICPELSASLGLSQTNFGNPCNFDSFTRDGASIDSLTVRVHNGHFRIQGTFSKSGTGWSATGSFEARVYLRVENGEILTRTEADEVDVDFDLAWYLYLTAGLTGSVLGPIAMLSGLVITGVADAVADGIAAGIVDNLASSALSGFSGTPLPIGPLADGFIIEDVELDDYSLAIIGSPIRDAEISIRSQGYAELHRGENLNLDTGTVRRPEDGIFSSMGWFMGEEGPMQANADIAWDDTYLGYGIFPQGISSFKVITGRAFNNITPMELTHALGQGDRISWDDESCLPNTSIPLGAPPTIPSGLIIGVRCGTGRKAKCFVWRDISYIHRLCINYVTYDRGHIPLPARARFEVHPVLASLHALRDERESGEEYYIDIDEGIEKDAYLDPWDEDNDK